MNYGTPWSVTSNFDIGVPPLADFKWATECYQAGQSIAFTNTSSSSFGFLTDTSYLWKVYNNTGFTSDTTLNIEHSYPEPGNYRIDLEIENTYGCADTASRIFALRTTWDLHEQGTYYENFETRPIGWQSGTSAAVTVNSWELGAPTKHGSPLRGFSGASSGVNCWYTYIPTNTAPREQSWVTSPCFDFTGTEKPMVKLDIWRLFTDDRDGANLQASSDSGKTWIPVGQLNDGVNWYNFYYGNPGAQSIGWSKIMDAGWIKDAGSNSSARHALDFLKGKPAVQFRIAYNAVGTAIKNDGIAFDNFQIVERNRVALIEHFTNSSSTATVKADSAVNRFINNNELNVINLQYHTSNPSGDPFYADNQVIPTARAGYYGLSTVPYGVLNGGVLNGVPKSQHVFDYTVDKPFDTNYAIIESLRDSKFSILLDSKVHGNTLDVEAQISVNEDLPATELSVRIAVIERRVTGITGSNGETTFENVVKAMLPGAAGTTIYQAWNTSDHISITESWDLRRVYNPTELRVVAFMQNVTTKEIYQATMDTIGVMTGVDNPISGSTDNGKSFVVYPNPADRFTFIKLSQETHDDVTIELYNYLGKLVYAATLPEGSDIKEIPLENYSDGLYILRLLTNNTLMGISKLIISK